MKAKRIRREILGDSIVIRSLENSKFKVADNSIWGYSVNNTETYRNYKSEFRKVIQWEPFPLYSIQRSGYKGSHTDYYFSLDLQSEMYPLKFKYLQKVFSDNPCFLNKLNQNLKWYQDYSSFNRKTKQFLIAEIYQSCQNP